MKYPKQFSSSSVHQFPSSNMQEDGHILMTSPVCAVMHGDKEHIITDGIACA
jgi:hypothetical protein